MVKTFFLGYIFLLQACSINQQLDKLSDASISGTKNVYIVEEDVSLKLYIVLKYPHIVEDIIFGEGPYIRTLIQLANRDNRNYLVELNKLRKILSSSNGIYGFSEDIENNYKNN